jgi:hypothetical protein
MRYQMLCKIRLFLWGVTVPHPGRQKDKTEIYAFWKQYVDHYDVINKIAAVDVVEGANLSALVLSGDYEKDVVALRDTLTKDGARRALSRFSKWVSRKRSKSTTIVLKEETLARLRQVAMHTDFDKDGYDLMFEYILESPEEFEEAKKEIRNMPLGLDAEQKNKLFLKYLTKEHYNLYRQVKTLVDHAYFSGWHDSRRRRGKRTYEHYESDLADFWSRTASND